MTRIGVLGTGMVGRELAGRLAELGHEVRMGARRADNPAARDWAEAAGGRASAGDFASAASFGEIVINATLGTASLAVVEQAGAAALEGKILVDVSNPLVHESGRPTTLSVANTDSLGEQLQRALPSTRVVKTLNTMNCRLMANPALVPEDHVVFVCGDDAEANARVTELLGELGWPGERVLDLGGIEAARGTEAFVLLWIPLMQALGGPDFNLALRRATT